MWFRNLQVYRLPAGWEMSPSAVEEALAEFQLRPCGGLQAQTRGWISPREDGQLVRSLERHLLIALGIEKKILPASVVKDETQARAARFEAERGFKPGRKTLLEMKEEVTAALLPRAFARRQRVRGWLDVQRGWMVIDAASAGAAEEFVEHLRNSLGGSFAVSRLDPDRSPVAAMTDWMTAGRAPGSFEIGDECELCSTDMERATVRFLRHSLEGEDVRRHLSAGKVVTRLGLVWREQLSLLLDDQLQVKKLKFLAMDEAEREQAADPDEQFDQDFALMVGTLRELLADLEQALKAG